VADHFTKWVEAYAVPNKEAETVAERLVTEFICRFGAPMEIHSDQGRQFESRLFQEMCRMLGMTKTRTSPYHPQGDGLVERFNRTLLEMLSKWVNENQTTWDDRLPHVMMAYRSSPQASTQFSPHFLMFGREVQLPLDVVFGQPQQQVARESDYVFKLRNDLEAAHQATREKLNVSQKIQKSYYDRRCAGNQYQEGDRVWLLNTVVKPGRTQKLHCPWEGPYVIKKRLSDVTYRIKADGIGPNGRRLRQRIVVHFNRLKPFF
jgi:hypothetical protein